MEGVARKISSLQLKLTNYRVTHRAMTKCRYRNWNWMWPRLHTYCTLCIRIHQQVEERHPEENPASTLQEKSRPTLGAADLR